MVDQDFLELVRLNPINAMILDRLPLLEAVAPEVYLVAGALFGTVWNVLSGRPPTENIKDYDLFYWCEDTSYEAEDQVIQQVLEVLGPVEVPIEVRNQARVHLWFNKKFNLNRPALTSSRDGIDQFLVECTGLGVNAQNRVYAPFGFSDLEAGILRLNKRNHSPGLYRAKVLDYQARWPWLQDLTPTL